MGKWQLLGIVSISCMGLSGLAVAGSSSINTNILPSDDTAGCTALIKQGDANPPTPTADLSTLQTCMASCELLYKSLGEQGRTTDMLLGTAYCHKSLNNLYFSSIAATINDQLDQQTQKQETDQEQAFLDKISAMVKQKQQNPPDNGGNDMATPPASLSTQNTPTATPAPTAQPPASHLDNINW
jgi:hypothetical protein